MQPRGTSSNRRRRTFTPGDRRRLVEAWRRSGLSQTGFAREHGITASHLSRWKTEFPEAILPTSNFVAVEVAEGPTAFAKSSSTNVYRLRLPCGIEVSVPPDFEAASLERLISSLDRSRC